MHESPAEWCIRCSRRQRQLDVAALVIVFILVVTLLAEFWQVSQSVNRLYALLALLPIIGIFIVWRWPAPSAHIGVNQYGWWLARNGEKQRVNWHPGSIRRRDYVCLVWGFWPWQCIRIRLDSLPDEESFRRLKYALYGSV